MPQVSDLTLISVLGGYIAGVVDDILTSSEIILLSVVNGQKRPSLTVFIKIYQIIILTPTTRLGNGIRVITCEIFNFRACCCHYSSSASNL